MDSGALPIRIADFAIDEAVVQAIRDCVREATASFALELDTLEAISIAEDYRNFTNQFDTGFGPQDRVEVSDTGVGVTPEVLRHGHVLSHVIVPSPHYARR